MTLEIMSTNQWIVLVDHLVWLQAVLYISLIHQNTVYVYDGDMGIRRLQACGLRGIKASRAWGDPQLVLSAHKKKYNMPDYVKKMVFDGFRELKHDASVAFYDALIAASSVEVNGVSNRASGKAIDVKSAIGVSGDGEIKNYNPSLELYGTTSRAMIAGTGTIINENKSADCASDRSSVSLPPARTEILSDGCVSCHAILDGRLFLMMSDSMDKVKMFNDALKRKWSLLLPGFSRLFSGESASRACLSASLVRALSTTSSRGQVQVNGLEKGKEQTMQTEIDLKKDDDNEAVPTQTVEKEEENDEGNHYKADHADEKRREKATGLTSLLNDEHKWSLQKNDCFRIPKSSHPAGTIDASFTASVTSTSYSSATSCSMAARIISLEHDKRIISTIADNVSDLQPSQLTRKLSVLDSTGKVLRLRAIITTRTLKNLAASHQLIERGLEYLPCIRSIAVLSLVVDSEILFQTQALVQGSEEYAVSLSFTMDGRVKSSACTCPSSGGSLICKHIVAVLLRLMSESVLLDTLKEMNMNAKPGVFSSFTASPQCTARKVSIVGGCHTDAVASKLPARVPQDMAGSELEARGLGLQGVTQSDHRMTCLLNSNEPSALHYNAFPDYSKCESLIKISHNAPKLAGAAPPAFAVTISPERVKTSDTIPISEPSRSHRSLPSFLLSTSSDCGHISVVDAREDDVGRGKGNKRGRGRGRGKGGINIVDLSVKEKKYSGKQHNEIKQREDRREDAEATGDNDTKEKIYTYPATISNKRCAEDQLYSSKGMVLLRTGESISNGPCNVFPSWLGAKLKREAYRDQFEDALTKGVCGIEDCTSSKSTKEGDKHEEQRPLCDGNKKRPLEEASKQLGCAYDGNSYEEVGTGCPVARYGMSSEPGSVGVTKHTTDAKGNEEPRKRGRQPMKGSVYAGSLGACAASQTGIAEDYMGLTPNEMHSDEIDGIEDADSDDLVDDYRLTPAEMLAIAKAVCLEHRTGRSKEISAPTSIIAVPDNGKSEPSASVHSVTTVPNAVMKMGHASSASSFLSRDSVPVFKTAVGHNNEVQRLKSPDLSFLHLPFRDARKGGDSWPSRHCHAFTSPLSPALAHPITCVIPPTRGMVLDSTVAVSPPTAPNLYSNPKAKVTQRSSDIFDCLFDLPLDESRTSKTAGTSPSLQPSKSGTEISSPPQRFCSTADVPSGPTPFPLCDSLAAAATASYLHAPALMPSKDGVHTSSVNSSVTKVFPDCSVSVGIPPVELIKSRAKMPTSQAVIDDILDDILS